MKKALVLVIGVMLLSGCINQQTTVEEAKITKTDLSLSLGVQVRRIHL